MPPRAPMMAVRMNDDQMPKPHRVRIHWSVQAIPLFVGLGSGMPSVPVIVMTTEHPNLSIMNQRYLFTVVLSATICASSAQYMMTTGPTEPQTNAAKFVSVDDDGNVVVVRTQQLNEPVLIDRFDPEGAIIWSRTLTHPDGGNWYHLNVKEDEAGGLWCAFTSDLGTDEGTGITTSLIHVAHVTANGALAEHWSHARTWATPEFSNTRIGKPQVDIQPDGTIVIAALGSTKFTIPFLDLYKFQSNGNLDWARNIGEYPGLASEGIPYSSSGMADSELLGPQSTSAGDILVGGRLLLHDLVVQSIGPNGDLLWKKGLRYTNTVYYTQYRDIVVDDEDQIHLVGRLALPTGQFLILPVYAADGTWLRTDLCTMNDLAPMNAHSVLKVGANGERTILSTGATAGMTTLIPSLGSSTAIHRTSVSVPIGQENVSLRWTESAFKNDRFVRAGTMHWQHSVLAYTTGAPALTMSSLDDFYSCVDSISTSAMVEVPSAILEFSEPNTQVADIGSWMLGPSTSAWVLAEGTTPETAPRCDLFSGIHEQENTTWLLNTVVERGEPIQLTDSETGLLELYSLTGSLVSQWSINGQRSVPTGTWSTGSYVLRFRSNNEQVVRTARVLVITE